MELGPSIMTKIDFTVFKGSQSGEIVEAKGSRELGPFDAVVEITYVRERTPSVLESLC